MRLKKVITTCLAIILAINICPAFTLNVGAAAEEIDVSDATYYDSGALKSLTTKFDWSTGKAHVRLVLMTERLRSPGEGGTNASHGDFTDYGYYGSSFADFSAVQTHDAANHTFGILTASDEIEVELNSEDNQLVLNLDENAIPLSTDETYYVYLWTQYMGNCYPDNLFLVINVQDGVVKYTPATGLNEYNTNAFEKVVAQSKYDVAVTKADHMTKTASSGEEVQNDLGVPMAPVVYTADTGYYFPDTYAVASVNGINVTRDSETQITVSGMPTADTQITLLPAEKQLLPLEEMVFTHAYDVQRNPAYPAKGEQIHMWNLRKPYLADGTQGTTNEGNWTLTPIGTYALVKESQKNSTSLTNIVTRVAREYTNLDADSIVLHELKDGDTHVAYGITVAYNKADSLAVFLGDNLAGSAGFLLSLGSKSGDVYTDATAILTDWVAPAVYTITVTDTANGVTKASAEKAIADDLITITATPSQGYHVTSVAYNDGADHEVALTGGAYTFTMPEKNVTVKATYAINTYTVTYKADGKVVDTQTVEYGKDAVAPTAPAKDGYTVTWDKDGKNITADTTITAKYEENAVKDDKEPGNQAPNGQAPDNQKPNTQTPENKGEGTKAPVTGDSNRVTMWFALAMCSCVVVKCTLEMERNRKRMTRR